MRVEDITLRREDYSTADPTRSLGPTRVRENSVSVVIPGMGALYRVNERWRLLAGVHRGYNPPSPGSSASEESSINVELGTRYDNDTLQFRIDLLRQRLREPRGHGNGLDRRQRRRSATSSTAAR